MIKVSHWVSCIWTSYETLRRWKERLTAFLELELKMTTQVTMVKKTQKNKRRFTHSILTQKLRTEDWLWFTEALIQNLKFGFKIYLATGSSWPILLQITLDWWSCTWEFQIGNMHSQRLVLIHRHCNGSDFWFQRDWLLILKIGEIKSIWIGRETETKRWQTLISTNSQMIKSKLRVSREKEEEWNWKQSLVMMGSLKNSQLNQVRLLSMQKRQLKRERPLS